MRRFIVLIHSTAPNLALQGEVQKRRSVSTLSKPRALARGASNGLILLFAILVFSNLGCKKIERLQKVLLKPEEKSAAIIKPVESMELAEAILWPKPYQFKLRRDPFRPLAGEASWVASDKVEFDEESKLKVIGIAITKDRPVALVKLAEGVFIFREGDKVGQYTLKKIEPKRLILEEEKTNKSLILETGEEK